MQSFITSARVELVAHARVQAVVRPNDSHVRPYATRQKEHGYGNYREDLG